MGGSRGHADPVADRLRGRFELSREIIRIAAGADQFNHLSTKFMRVRRAGFSHVGKPPAKVWGAPSNRVNFSLVDGTYVSKPASEGTD
jgi:hypothetical protein